MGSGFAVTKLPAPPDDQQKDKVNYALGTSADDGGGVARLGGICFSKEFRKFREIVAHACVCLTKNLWFRTSNGESLSCVRFT